MSLDVILYIVAAIALYVAADRIVSLLERRAGRRFGNRALLFMIIVLVLLLVGLKLIGFPGLPQLP